MTQADTGQHPNPGRPQTPPAHVQAQDVVMRHFAQLSPGELYGILQLRNDVFIVEQDCPYLDLDGLDTLEDTVHAFIPRTAAGLLPSAARTDIHGGNSGIDLAPLAYARILPAEVADGPAAHPGARSIGRVVSASSARGTGAGKAVFAALVDSFGTESGLTLNAQKYAAGFYTKFGFEVCGPEFLEDGIPHVPMIRNAANVTASEI